VSFFDLVLATICACLFELPTTAVAVKGRVLRNLIFGADEFSLKPLTSSALLSIPSTPHN
jgi:hypothetical protein